MLLLSLAVVPSALQISLRKMLQDFSLYTKLCYREKHSTSLVHSWCTL